MKTTVYGLLLNNGELANLDFCQGTHISIYPTSEINMAFLSSKEEAEWYLNDFKLFKLYGAQGLFKKGGNEYQYHNLIENDEFDLIKIVQIEMKVVSS